MRQQGFTVWFTGLPSSGKSTLALLLEKELDDLGLPVVVLDGDAVRQRLTKGLGYSREDRDENISRIAYVAKLLTKVGAVAIAAAISPYSEPRKRARMEIQNFVEVYVKCPLQTCVQRDVKGLYAKAMSGELRNFTGITDPYEPPENAEIVIHTDRESPEESLVKILKALVALKLVPNEGVRRLASHQEETKSGEQATPKVTQYSI